MSEQYLHQTPPLISESVRALLAVLTLSPSTRVEAQVRLQLGLVLYHHTNNVVESRQHLDRAVSIVCVCTQTIFISLMLHVVLKEPVVWEE